MDKDRQVLGWYMTKLDDAIKYEPNHRLVKNGVRDLGKKTKKNTGKKAKKIRGVMPRK